MARAMRPICGALLAAILGAPALAQDDLCGGVGAGGQWIGGEGASDIATSGDYFEQMALVLTNNEYTALFEVSAPTEVRVEAQGRGGGDPVIDLRDAGGTIIVSDDDSGGEGASFAEVPLDPGTYCLSMQSYDRASPLTGFVRVGRLEHPRLTLGSTVADTYDIEPEAEPEAVATRGLEDLLDQGCGSVSNFLASGPVDGSLAMGGASMTASANEVGAWGFTLAEDQAVTITASNEIADPSITLYDADGNYLADNDDYDGLNSRIEFRGDDELAAGDYCIEVAALSDADAPITVSIEGFDPLAELDMLIASGEASPPLDGSYLVEDLGVLSERIRHDIQVGARASWFKLDVDEGGLILIEVVASGSGDPVAFLFDDIGRQIAYNDDASPQSYDSMIAARVLPGTYLLGIRQYDESYNSLVRLVIERYVPAR